jgi:uncharacterized membrane protein YuzA (DUF378 family)
MEIEYQNTKQDYTTFYKTRIKDLFIKRSVIICILAFFLFAALCGKDATWTRCLFGIFGTIVFMAAIIYYIPLLVVMGRLNKQLSKSSDLIEKVKIAITNDGLKSERGDTLSLKTWNSIKSAGLCGEHLYITSIDNKVIIIPKRSFLSETEAINFLGTVRSQNNSLN